MAKKKVNFTDTVFRDAHQSLFATRMRTEHMLPVLEKMDEAGFWSLEMWGGASFDACLRYLDENPWDRIREFKKHLKKTKLQMLLRGQNIVGYRHYSDSVLEKFLGKTIELGMDVIRIFDALNDVANMEKSILISKKLGAIVQAGINYTLSPVHTDEHFIKVAVELKELGADIITIKDMAGLLGPKSAADLITRLKEKTGLEVCLHAHCTTGLAPATYYSAMCAGVDYIDTAMSPLSSGTSQPPTETMAVIAKDLGLETGLDMKLLNELAKYFSEIREHYKDLISPVAEKIDIKALIYQVPGGMLTNLVSQLEAQGALEKLEEVLTEIPAVREDLGWVPLVTPTSQIVGTQAAYNVMTGKRYKVIIKEVKDLCRGLYGRTPAPIKKEMLEKALAGEKPIEGRPADLAEGEWEKAVEEMKTVSRLDEDIISYVIFPTVTKDYFERRANPMKKANTQKTEDYGKKTRRFKIRLDGAEYSIDLLEVKDVYGEDSK